RKKQVGIGSRRRNEGLIGRDQREGEVERCQRSDGVGIRQVTQKRLRIKVRIGVGNIVPLEANGIIGDEEMVQQEGRNDVGSAVVDHAEQDTGEQTLEVLAAVQRPDAPQVAFGG